MGKIELLVVRAMINQALEEDFTLDTFSPLAKHSQIKSICYYHYFMQDYRAENDFVADAETLIDRFLAGDSRDFVLACPERKTRWSDALD